MTTGAEETIRRARRGQRLAQIREALQLTGDGFAALLHERLLAVGVHTHFDRAKISRLESGTRDLSADEIVIVAQLDPKKRSVAWLAWGDAGLKKHDPPPHPVASKKSK